MNIEVTSVSRQRQSLSKTAAAVFVITQEDIQRSGATNIPDLLRIVPGVQVGQINANSWAISVRGFKGRFSNKLLVMVDGRTVYVPTFGGVFYEVLDLPLEDIERIPSAFFVDRLDALAVPAYTRLDSDLTWQWDQHFSLSVFGQNILQDRHLEYVDSTLATTSSLMKRSAYAKLTWRF